MAIRIEEVTVFHEMNDRFLVNADTVNSCIVDLNSNPIVDRNEFYISQVIERIEKCNNLYVREFDESLNKLVNSIDNDSSFNEFSKVIKCSLRLTSDIYNKFIDIIRRIYCARSN